MPENLLLEKWSGIDSAELMILLRDRVGGPGQYDSELEPEKFFLPLARSKGQIALTYAKGLIVRIEPGAAFDAAGFWEGLALGKLEQFPRFVLTKKSGAKGGRPPKTKPLAGTRWQPEGEVARRAR